MATQTLTFTATAGHTLTAKVYPVDSNTQFGSDRSCTEDGPGVTYRFTIDGLSGQYRVVILKGTDKVGCLFTPTLTDTVQTVELQESLGMANIISRVPESLATSLATYGNAAPTQTVPAVGSALSRDQLLHVAGQAFLNRALNAGATTETIKKADGTQLVVNAITKSGDDVTAVARSA